MTSVRRTLLVVVGGAAAFIAVGVVGRLVAVMSPSTYAAAPKPPPPIKLPPIGFLAFEVHDADGAELIPAKLTLVGVDGSPDPRFTRGDIGREEAGAVAAYNRIFSLAGAGIVVAPIGTYDVYVSRGPEWDLKIVRKLRIEDKKVATVRAELRHVIDTPGWISADFHVHAAPSPDSIVPLRDRIFEFVTDGVEIITATDHNVITDYGPEIAELGVGELIGSIVGDEITTNDWGHFGAFPLTQRREETGHGAIHLRGNRPDQFFGEVRERAPDAVINVHHPRIDNEIGYFTLGHLDSDSDDSERPGFSFDFDAIEVLNGYQDPDRRSVDRVIADWMALLDHGHLVTATGNSDTHHLTHNLGGYPRNYIAVQDDKPARVTPQQIAAAVKARHVFFTTGPFVSLRAAGGRIGDVVAVKDGHARVEVKVSAAPWIAVNSATLYVNGAVEKRWTIPDSTDPVRLSDTLDVTVTRDSYVLVRVDGDRPLAPVVGDTKRFDVRPFALTNPVFLDVDGHPGFDAPKAHGRHRPIKRWQARNR